MKRRMIGLLALCALVVCSSPAVAEEGLLRLHMERGLLIDEAGNICGLGDEAAYDAWRREEWSKGNATTDVAWAPQCVVNGLAYSYYNGDLFGYLDEAALTEDRYWTTSEDPYYHADEGCDGGAKFPISAQAAREFEKRACPLCLLTRDPLSCETQDRETPFAPLFTCPEGTDLAPYPACYAGSIDTEEGLIHLISDEASGNFYAFRDRIDGDYRLAFTKYSLQSLTAARDAAREILSQNNIPATLEIDIPENKLKITPTKPSDADRAKNLPLPLCAEIEIAK